jgi:PilZ domain-containing protein
MGHQDTRGLRFAFDARAEIAPESDASAVASAHVTELSLQGCFLETSTPFDLRCPVLLKIFASDEHIEVHATVLYVRQSGLGLAFREMKPNSRNVLQNWMLRMLDSQVALSQS